jgi:hypothetical protein
MTTDEFKASEKDNDGSMKSRRDGKWGKNANEGRSTVKEE